MGACPPRASGPRTKAGVAPGMRGPLTGTGSGPATQGVPAASAPPVRRGPVRERGERYGCSSIRGNHMNLGGPTASGLADGLGSVFFNAPVPSGWTLTVVLSIETASSLIRTICSRCRNSNTRSSTPFFRPPVHPGINRVPVAKARRQSPPLAALLGHIQDCVEHLQVRQADIATLHWKDRCNTLVLNFGNLT